MSIVLVYAVLIMGLFSAVGYLADSRLNSAFPSIDDLEENRVALENDSFNELRNSIPPSAQMVIFDQNGNRLYASDDDVAKSIDANDLEIINGTEEDQVFYEVLQRFENKEDDYNEVILEQFIKHSGRPVFSMEAATRHPLQSFADLITIEEYKKTERPKVVMTWAPHPRPLPQAVPNSFAEWMNATDYDFVITHPEGYELDPKFVGNAHVEYDQMKAFEGADFVYAKNWAAYTGDNYGQILSKDRAWTVGERQMAVTNNAYFMHCLPVRRNMIVTDDVIESPQSIVIPEAANREISATVVLKRLLESL